jgi:hypothetical protein
MAMENRFKKAATGRLMVKDAIEKLGNPQGSSLYAIKKEIFATYHLDGSWGSDFVRNALKESIQLGLVVQVSGTVISNARFQVMKLEAAEMSESICIVEEDEDTFYFFIDEQ